mmetsp:Transcript_34506/g.68102  ORF Transcript_34506/g.68102 Transcript_34506/m.68102 type:complete len:102 (+) Transcript_34506:918-1223(+)
MLHLWMLLLECHQNRTVKQQTWKYWSHRPCTSSGRLHRPFEVADSIAAAADPSLLLLLPFQLFQLQSSCSGHLTPTQHDTSPICTAVAKASSCFCFYSCFL